MAWDESVRKEIITPDPTTKYQLTIFVLTSHARLGTTKDENAIFVLTGHAPSDTAKDKS
ncbi:hypothetical protein FTV88_1302 [Heliorestis convoluta]|uniref:Uncharacterized protein n=1 Tax=Heliorestis convoluta TaxID=356322 RepID=A0A5Q2N0X5_9FIRM|nr:hypothetical protein FTV88_1302 [Heliorestis convoluta]